jgi:CRP-like cAMP-binding protein
MLLGGDAAAWNAELDMIKKVTLDEAWDGVADCRNCAVRDSVLFANLREADFDRIHQPIEQFILPPGSILYRAGNKAEHLFTLRKGCVKLVQYLADGGQRIVRLLRTTDLAGLEALVEDAYRHDAVVLQETEVCRLPVQVVNNVAEDNPKLYRDLVARWHRALNDADAWITELSTGSAKERVARLLLRLTQGDGPAKCVLFSREDMGAMLAITTETASRVIADFKRQGLIKKMHDEECEVDVEGLKRLVAG